MADLTLKSTFELTSGNKLPILGFGVWDSPSHLTTQSCVEALKVGYRHIDTAQVYGNEKEVGEAVRKSGLRRGEIFITSKIYTPGSDVEATYQKCLDSVKKIAGGGDDSYLDLMLIHNANVGQEQCETMWRAMERLPHEGRFKAIGVSNFGVGHLERLGKQAKVWPPAVNQLELHPWCQQRQVVDHCREAGVVIEAYCPLVRNQKADDPTLTGVAEKHGKTTAQVLLRYSLQKSWSPLPKSDNAERIAQNADLYGFHLDEGDMQKLDAQDQGGNGSLVMAVSNS